MTKIETNFQNIDLPDTNPLSATPLSYQPRLNFTKLFSNPKITALIVLVMVIILLSLTALISRFLKTRSSTITPIAPLPSTAITPTPISLQQLPQAMQSSLQIIETNIATNTEFLPPDLDPNIGL